MSTVQWVAGGVKSGGGAIIAYSYNGTTWAASAPAVFNYIVYTVVHNGVLWVAGGSPNNNASYSSLGYSYDGINWTASSSGKSILSNCVGVDYGNGMFVAVGSGTSYNIAYSYDGINWTGCASNTFFGNASFYGYCVKYANSMWVAGGSGTSSQLIGYSNNGINWTLAGATQLNAGINGFEYNGTIWVAVGTNTTNNASVIYSSNGISWTSANSANTLSVGRAVKWNGSKFVAVGSGPSRITSTNGINWTSFTPANSNSGLGIEYNASTGLWVISQDYSSIGAILYSTDGTTWSKVSNVFVGGGARGASYARPSPYFVGSIPSITSITNGPNSFSVYFTPSTGGNPAPTTYYYSLNGGTYINANTTTSPISITGIQIATTYNVGIIATNLAGNTAVSNIAVGFIPYPCFLEGTKILQFNPETYQDEYVLVETLRKGDLIVTSESGYKQIHSIGYKTIANPKSDPNPSNRLYKFSNKSCPTMFEPLYITGEHCTLHRHIPTEKRDQITEHMGDVYITEEYYRMPAFLDDRKESYDREDEPATIWHFALENESVAHNYGVFANGLLVESCAIESLMEKSGMRLLE